MKTIIFSLLALTLLTAQSSLAYVCYATKDKPEVALEVGPAENAAVVDGLVRVYLGKIDNVSFVIWEGGPYVYGVPSSHIFANIYDDRANQSQLGEAFLVKSEDKLSLELKANDAVYSLVCR